MDFGEYCLNKSQKYETAFLSPFIQEICGYTLRIKKAKSVCYLMSLHSSTGTLENVGKSLILQITLLSLSVSVFRSSNSFSFSQRQSQS